MMEYTVHTTYKMFDRSAGAWKGFCRTDKIAAKDKDTAKEIAWNRILAEKASPKMESQSARLSRRN